MDKLRLSFTKLYRFTVRSPSNSRIRAVRRGLAEYRQRKAQSDGQKKQKKKKQKGSEPEDSGVQQEGAGERKETPTTEFSFSRTLRSGETVKHDQTYTIEVSPALRPSHCQPK
ncbi:hypothetical protein AOLI_G00189320 [Acnodon oligacanthus]